MDRLLTANSGFGPVHNINVSLKSATTTNNSSNTRNVSEEPATITVAQMKNVSEKGVAWKGYRDCVTSQAMMQNYANFKKSGALEKLMTWLGGAWADIPADALARAKEAFEERRAMVEIEVDGNECIFDFFRMLVVDVGSGLQRSIAWIDVNGTCFFPKFFIDESLLDDDETDDDDDETCFVIPKIEIEIKVDSSSNNNASKNKDDDEKKDELSGSRKRKKSEEEDTADSSCNSGVGNGNAKRQRLVTWPNVRVVGEEERSYAVVKDLFMKGMTRIDPRVEITSIHQFTKTGPIEKARYEAFHKQMESTEAARGRSNTVFAWHGTSRKGVSDILAHGFGYPSKVVGSQGHGIGVYFSPARLPHVSDALAEADDNGEKHVVLCRVVLGNVEKVGAGSQQSYPSSINFDNGMDDLVNPKWFVVWTTNMNTHILPECVVSYKCSDRQQGAMQGSEPLPWIPFGPKPEAAKLFFSRLGRLLPSDKVEQLKALCMEFKARNMAKDLFIRQLKSVVGNEMLRSAISGIEALI